MISKRTSKNETRGLRAERQQRTAPQPGESLPAALVISVGCPAGIGPEVAVSAAFKRSKSKQSAPCVLIADRGTLEQACRLLGVRESCLTPLDPSADLAALAARKSGQLWFHDPGVKVAAKDRKPGAPSKQSGKAQLAWVEAGYALTKRLGRAALVTGPVSKAAIAASGTPGAERFLGHTEWLQALDDAPSSVMCFAADKLTTSLVTTHVRVQEVSAQIREESVAESILALAELVQALGKPEPTLAVCSLNPHAGESELLGDEERTAILPGIQRAKKRLGRRVKLVGPIGAETAYRKALKGDYAGVVAMYHDQATIPMKLVAFGDAVNVTAGLSIVRTSVDHGTGYDIAWRGIADADGMRAALDLGAALVEQRRKA
ncbi:MAG: 4-hydroxythreonine-4-phosphate dehydrogenase PdxA [Polyangiaceae bacterium]